MLVSVGGVLPAVPLIIAALISPPLAAYAWRRRELPGAQPLIIMALAVMAWTSAAAVYLFVRSDGARLCWVTVEFAGISALPPAWLALSLRVTGFRGEPPVLAKSLGVGFGVLTTLLVATNGWHGLFWHNLAVGATGSPQPAVAYWLFFACAYTLTAVSLVRLATHWAQSAPQYRRQTGVLVCAGLVPLAISLLSELAIIPSSPVDPTPLAFLVSIVLIWWGLFKFGLLDLIPVAHELLIESLADGVLVVDASERILESNPAARAMIDGLTANSAGASAGGTLSLWPELRRACVSAEPAQLELRLEKNGLPVFLEVRATPLMDIRQRPIGHLLLLRDVSERHRAEVAREALITELRAASGQVRTLSGLLPICSSCKQIRDKAGLWHPLDVYLTQHTEAQLTHGLCPECVKRYFPGI